MAVNEELLTVRDAAEMGRRIRIIRADFDWSLGDLHKRTGITAATWSRYENGERFPTASSIIALCKAAGITPDQLLGYWPTRVSTNGEPQTRRRRASDVLLVAASG